MATSLVASVEARPEPVLRVVAGGGTDTGDGVPATQAQLSAVEGAAARPNGELVLADTYNQRIRLIDRRGQITTIAGTGTAGNQGLGGMAADAQLRFPFGVDVAPNGDVLIADTLNHRVVAIDRAGRLQVIAGTGNCGFSGDNGPATDAQLRLPYTARWT